MRRRLDQLATIFVVFLVLAPYRVDAQQGDRRPDVVYMDQSTGIDFATYTATWPQLAPYIADLKNRQTAAVESELKQQSASRSASDGELNLLAQLEWQHQELDAADQSIAKALEIQTKQPLNWFQQAMVDFAHLRHVSGADNSYQSGLSSPLRGLATWKWQRRTRDAYQHTFDLDSRNVSARYYLAYSYMNTPRLVGGDISKAVQLSTDGIGMGQVGFYAVRADAHRLAGELDAANADYDMGIDSRVIKLGGLLDAAHEELARQQFNRAKRYYDWAVYCRPDSSKVYEGLGDYYAAIHDVAQARKLFQTALQHDPKNDGAKLKLSQLSVIAR